MNAKELKDLIDTLRKNGVKSYEHDGVKIELGDPPPTKAEPPKKLTDAERKQRHDERWEKIKFAHVGQ